MVPGSVDRNMDALSQRFDDLRSFEQIDSEAIEDALAQVAAAIQNNLSHRKLPLANQAALPARRAIWLKSRLGGLRRVGMVQSSPISDTLQREWAYGPTDRAAGGN